MPTDIKAENLRLEAALKKANATMKGYRATKKQDDIDFAEATRTIRLQKNRMVAKDAEKELLEVRVARLANTVKQKMKARTNKNESLLLSIIEGKDVELDNSTELAKNSLVTVRRLRIELAKNKRLLDTCPEFIELNSSVADLTEGVKQLACKVVSRDNLIEELRSEVVFSTQWAEDIELEFKTKEREFESKESDHQDARCSLSHQLVQVNSEIGERDTKIAELTARIDSYLCTPEEMMEKDRLASERLLTVEMFKKECEEFNIVAEIKEQNKNLLDHMDTLEADHLARTDAIREELMETIRQKDASILGYQNSLINLKETLSINNESVVRLTSDLTKAIQYINGSGKESDRVFTTLLNK